MKALFFRDIKIVWSEKSTFFLNILFFLAFALTTVFALGPETLVSKKIGPTIIWLATIFTILLNFDLIFQKDQQDGSLDILILGQNTFSIITLIITKAAAHWVANIVPLLLIQPILDIMFHMDIKTSINTSISLLIGTPALTFIGTAGAAIACTLSRGQFICAMLVLPFVTPILLFGIQTSQGITEAEKFNISFILLIACNCFFLIICPIIAHLALKYLAEE